MKSIAEIAAEIAAQEEATPELRKRVTRVVDLGMPYAIPSIRSVLLTAAMDACQRLERELSLVGEDDRDAVDRVVAWEFNYIAAFIVRALKERAGEKMSPARFALVAYEVAAYIAEMADAWNGDKLSTAPGGAQ